VLCARTRPAGVLAIERVGAERQFADWNAPAASVVPPPPRAELADHLHPQTGGGRAIRQQQLSAIVPVGSNCTVNEALSVPTLPTRSAICAVTVCVPSASAAAVKLAELAVSAGV